MKISGLVRRTSYAIGVSLVALTAANSFATVAGAKELTFANFMPPTNPYEKGAFQPFAEKVKEATGGDITVHVFSGGELGPGPVEQYSRAVDGVADLAVGLQGYTAANFPLTLLTELPGVLDEATGTDTVWKNIDLLKSEYQRVQLVSLWTNSTNILYTRNKPVRTLADVKGMKIRVPSRNAGLIVEAWGGTPVSMAVSEIYNSMQTGVIDGALIDGTGTKAFKLGEVANYLTVGMETTISPFFIVMNKDSFEGLSADQQAAVLKVGREVSTLANQTQLKAANDGVEAFGTMAGKELIKLTPEEAKPFDEAAAGARDKVVAEAKAAGLPADKVISAMMAK